MMIEKKIINKIIYIIIVILISAIPISNSKVEASMPTIEDYWNGAAEWELHYIRPINGNNPLEWHSSAGTAIRIVGDTWYNFQRYAEVINNVAHLGMQCYKSTDNGLTWSAPVTVVKAEPNTPWSLHVTDGDFWYDSSSNKWIALLQTLESGPGKEWQGCYFERSGADPMGLFSSPQGFIQPAINPKEIWSQIATSQDKKVVQLAGGQLNKVFDEGTFEIVKYDFISGKYTIGFHGAIWDGGVVGSRLLGVRGLATTTDFQTYTKLASDSIFDKFDTNKWNVDWNSASNGSIGVGHATMMQEGSYWYAIVEGADMSLAGTEGQNWTMGLMRSDSLNNTNWENWASNPIPDFKPRQVKIEWQYPRLFKDADGTTYLSINKAYPADETAFLIYKLVAKDINQISVDDKSNQIIYSGSWYDWHGTFQNYFGTEKFSVTSGNFTEFSFTGTAIDWVGKRGPNMGIANVYLDGMLQSVVDLYSPIGSYQETVFNMSGLTNIQHTIRIEIAGTKNLLSTGYAVVIDKFKYATPTIPNIVAIKSYANHKYVKAKNGGIDPLISASNIVNESEKFQMIYNADGTVSLKALANNMYVQAQNGGNDDLKACSPGIGGSWEKFQIIDAGGGLVALKSMANNKFVQAQNAGIGNLKACANGIGGSWEQFIIVPWDDK